MTDTDERSPAETLREAIANVHFDYRSGKSAEIALGDLYETVERTVPAIEAVQHRAEAAEERLQRIASVSVVRGRCVFCAHPDDPADGSHTSTCPVIDPDSDPCPYVHDSGDRCGLQFEHGGSHDFDY